MVTKIKALSPLFNILIFGPIFAPRPHMANIARMDPKPALKLLGCVLAYPFQNHRPEPPLKFNYYQVKLLASLITIKFNYYQV